ncbi:hypothetical protein GUITHDRAFT_136139 [Guillardia theta CCMP2712]|uniref:Scaffold protein Nfu/NifU N-terminal domain-containing protein n=1 Tax=Guillardia theta (strain CCMP2712) TaxID=905079 RepID=L1JN25_GUITC|nr:hypothetical protein GUITHDRAFT_136139 [Guillardia theta CCMP2712]EKX49478.1 hypothetical protein GUITHDRAFT_136139 [Guillardia theta CCMP2712]|eukprot:XP_005836458.1 hypothetical protein GUITHDRAFT_136139 [Guillardia theta CCMP2712]
MMIRWDYAHPATRDTTRRSFCEQQRQADLHIDCIATPNPDALKFDVGHDVTGSLQSLSISHGDLHMFQQDQHLAHIATQLFAVKGVRTLLFGPDFITVVKDPETEWAETEELLMQILQEELNAARQDCRPLAKISQESINQLIASKFDQSQILELLEEKVAPHVRADGGDVQFRGFKDGVVWLSLVGACTSCSSSTVTVRFMIRNLLMHYMDEVRCQTWRLAGNRYAGERRKGDRAR